MHGLGVLVGVERVQSVVPRWQRLAAVGVDEPTQRQ
jgi:hypothetical protein